MRNEYFGDYVTVAIFLIVGALLVVAAVFVAGLVAPSRPNLLKSTAYESGIEPITESSLSGHLSNPDDADAAEPEEAVEDASTLAEDDYQLNEALNLLKGLTILSRKG